MHGIHLTANARTASVDCLQAMLSDGIDLALDGHGDATAERIVQLGAIAEGSAQAVAASTRLPGHPLALRAA